MLLVACIPLHAGGNPTLLSHVEQHYTEVKYSTTCIHSVLLCHPLTHYGILGSNNTMCLVVVGLWDVMYSWTCGDAVHYGIDCVPTYLVDIPRMLLGSRMQ